MKNIRKLNAYYLVFIHIKIVLCFWSVSYLLKTPDELFGQLGTRLGFLISVFIIFGSIFAVVGLIRSVCYDNVTGLFGIRLEIFGLSLVASSLWSYSIVQAFLFNEGAERSSSFLTYCLACFVYARVFYLFQSFRKEI